MKKLAAVTLILFSLSFGLSACKKDKNQKPGVCYCEFFKGDDQEYDLNHLTRVEQLEQCEIHSSNASHFGGSCQLK